MATLVICESAPRNVAILSRLSELTLIETRSHTQLRQAVQEQWPAVVAIEVRRDRLADAVHEISQINDTTQAAVIAMPDFALGRWDGWLVEAGADLVFRSILQRRAARVLMQNSLRRYAELADQQQLSLTDRIWADLPWKRHNRTR